MTDQDIEQIKEALKPEFDEVKSHIDMTYKSIIRYLVVQYLPTLSTKLFLKMRCLVKKKLYIADAAALLGKSTDALERQCQRDKEKRRLKWNQDEDGHYYFFLDDLKCFLSGRSDQE